MLKLTLLATIALTSIIALSEPASAIVCARGPYRAGCVGPNGAVGVHRYGYGTYRGGLYRGGAYRYRGGYRRLTDPPWSQRLPPLAKSSSSPLSAARTAFRRTYRQSITNWYFFDGMAGKAAAPAKP